MRKSEVEEAAAVEHYLVILFIHGLMTVDYLFQRRARSAIVDFDELLLDPAGYFDRQEVVVGPLRRNFVALFLAGLCGSLPCCMFSMYRADHPRPGFGPPPPSEQMMVVVPPFIILSASFLVFRHLFRGAEMVLRRGGVVLRSSGKSVFCPWPVFRSANETPWYWGAGYWVIPTWPPAVPGVVRSRAGSVLGTGAAIRTRTFFFRRDGRIALSNSYAIRLADLSELIARLGRKLGTNMPIPLIPALGEPVPEEMT